MTMLKGHTFAFKALFYFDQFVAALLWRQPGLTISSKCGLAMRHTEPGLSNRAKRWLGRILNWIDTDHCEKAIVTDIRHAHAALRTLYGAP
jgi:hypothetical protein